MGTKAARKSEPTYCTAVAPSTEPAKAPAAGQAKRRRSTCPARQKVRKADPVPIVLCSLFVASRSEEHTSELQSLMRISYAVFCLKKKKKTTEILVTK